MLGASVLCDSGLYDNPGAGCLCKALICQSSSVDAHEIVSQAI
jgi:hypothetical protein